MPIANPSVYAARGRHKKFGVVRINLVIDDASGMALIRQGQASVETERRHRRECASIHNETSASRERLVCKSEETERTSRTRLSAAWSLQSSTMLFSTPFP